VTTTDGTGPARPPGLAQRLTDAAVTFEQTPAETPALVKLARAWNGFFVARVVSLLLDAETVPHRDVYELAESWCTQALDMIYDVVNTAATAQAVEGQAQRRHHAGELVSHISLGLRPARAARDSQPRARTPPGRRASPIAEPRPPTDSEAHPGRSAATTPAPSCAAPASRQPMPSPRSAAPSISARSAGCAAHPVVRAAWTLADLAGKSQARRSQVRPGIRLRAAVNPPRGATGRMRCTGLPRRARRIGSRRPAAHPGPCMLAPIRSRTIPPVQPMLPAMSSRRSGRTGSGRRTTRRSCWASG